MQDEHGVGDGNVLEKVGSLFEVVEEIIDCPPITSVITGRDREDSARDCRREVVAVTECRAERARLLVPGEHELGERCGVRADR